MSEHGRIQRLLAVYDDLQQGERDQVDDHLRACARCAEALSTYRAMDQVLHDLITEQAHSLALQPAGAFARISSPGRRPIISPPAGLAQRTREIVQPRRYSLRLVSAVVLLLLLMILSALFGGWGPFEEPVLASTPTVEQPVATPVVLDRSSEPARLSPVHELALAMTHQPLNVATPAPKLEQAHWWLKPTG
jgi:anti-sigma factor RsiW